MCDDLEALADAFLGDASVHWVDDRVRPYRVYATFQDRPPSPALYAELELEGELVEVVVHNFGDYERAMEGWGIGVVDLLVLDELHELTHWAMTDAERRQWEGVQRRTGRPDGHWFNRLLLDVLEDLDGRERDYRAHRRGESLLGRAMRWLTGRWPSGRGWGNE